jgi:hypothetical protein
VNTTILASHPTEEFSFPSLFELQSKVWNQSWTAEFGVHPRFRLEWLSESSFSLEELTEVFRRTNASHNSNEDDHDFWVMDDQWTEFLSCMIVYCVGEKLAQTVAEAAGVWFWPGAIGYTPPPMYDKDYPAEMIDAELAELAKLAEEDVYDFLVANHAAVAKVTRRGLDGHFHFR